MFFTVFLKKFKNVCFLKKIFLKKNSNLKGKFAMITLPGVSWGVFVFFLGKRTKTLRRGGSPPPPLHSRLPLFLNFGQIRDLIPQNAVASGNCNFCRKSSLNQAMNNGTEYISLDLRHFFEIFVQSVTKLKRCGFTAPSVYFLTMSNNEALFCGDYFPHWFNAFENKTKFQKNGAKPT